MSNFKGLISTLLVGLFLLGALLTLLHLRNGSIHNSDDAIYAQVMREVANGRIYPLTFSGNEFDAKPPLPFWIGGGLVRLLGDQDSSYRLLSALSFLAILTFTGLVLAKRYSIYSASLAVLLLLGSPLLMTFSRRVMLDIPLSASFLGILLVAFAFKKPTWLFFWILAAVGWLTKEIAVLPALLAALLIIASDTPRALLRPSFLIGFLVFLAACITLHIFRGSETLLSSPTVSPVTHEVLAMAPSSDIYFDLLFSDTPFFWLLPLAWLWIFLERRELRKLPIALGLASLLQLVAIWVTKTNLPHYLVPAYPVALVLIAILAHRIPAKSIRITLIFLAVVQVARANQFQFDPKSPEIDPAAATKALSVLAARTVPSSAPICVVNTYLPGFRFYTNRETHGFYTGPKALEAHRRITEFQDFVYSISLQNIPQMLAKECGGYGIMPLQQAEHTRGAQIISQEGLLAFVATKE